MKRLIQMMTKLLLSFAIAILFAGWSVFLAAVAPEGNGERSFMVQAVTLSMAMTFALPLLAALIVRIRCIGAVSAWLEMVYKRSQRDWKKLLALNVFTILGPPFYVASVILISAGAANWIDLGLVPILILAFGWTLRNKVTPGTSQWLGAGLMLGGVAIVAWFVLRQDPGNLTGLAIGAISAMGTAASALVISELQRDRDEPLPLEAVLPLRYFLATVVSFGLWGVIAINGAAELQIPNVPRFIFACAVLFVLPNYLVLVALRSWLLHQLAYVVALIPVSASLLERFFPSNNTPLGMTATLAAGVLIIGGMIIDGLGSQEF